MHGFDLGVLIEMFAQPEFGTTHGRQSRRACTLLCSSSYRPRFFCPACCKATPPPTACRARISSAPAGATCGDLSGCMIVAGIVMGAVAAALFGMHGVLERKALESTNELLLFYVRSRAWS